MANEVLHKTGTPLVWAAADYGDGDFSGGEDYALDLDSLADGAARQGGKGDLGATRARLYMVVVAIEFDVAPTAGTTVDFYWSSSQSETAATANMGGASGSDGAYKAGEEAEWVKQLEYLGSLTATNDAATTVQKQVIGAITPSQRYGMPVVVNNGGQALEGDGVEMYFALVPIVDEVQ